MAERYMMNASWFEPLSCNQNVLAGKHAYSYCNSLNSGVQAYLSSGDRKYLDAVTNGFRMIREHSFATSWRFHFATVRASCRHYYAQSKRTRSLGDPGDFAGMSFEQETVRSDFNGGSDVHLSWLEGGNTVYNQFVKTLGVHNVRIGANTGEGGSYPYPTDFDGAHVNDFAAEVGTGLLWQLPIGNARYNVSTYAGYAQRMMSNKAGKSQAFRTVFEGGNEPDVNGVSYATWQSRFDGYFDALVSPLGANLFMTGPSAAFNQSYANSFATDANYHNGNQSKIRYIAQHWYPNGGRADYSSVDAAIDAMLSSANGTKYQNFYGNFGQTAVNNGYLGRISESNSMYSGGFPGASDSFASALWSLDYLCFFAQNTHLEGINFHTANETAAYNPIEPVGRASSYTLMGVGYGILAYSQWSTGNGNKAIAQSTSNPEGINFANYANLQADGSIRMALINKTHQSSTSTNNNVTVTVNPGRSYGHAQVMYLSQVNGDATQTAGISLGGQDVSQTGTWTGGYTQTILPTGNSFTISVPHTSAALVRFY